MLKPLHLACLLSSALVSSPAHSSDDFVEANVIGILYHELGHAVIDIEGIPIFGQEEDAADVFSVFLVDALFEPDASEDLAYGIALGFWAEAIAWADHGDEIPWWDVHGPDEQRFYNTVCIFYGADPDARAAFVEDLDLPEDRADSCPEEFDQANAAWGAVLDEMQERGAGNSLSFEGGDGSLTASILASEIADLNGLFSLSHPLTVRMESCDEANAYYDPERREIIYCTEFEAHLRGLAE